MIPAPFTYVSVATIADACDALVEHGDEARILAGGQSLLPLMKLRLANPTHLIDVGEITELTGIADSGNELVIGAMTRHVDVARSPLVRQHIPLVGYASSLVGDPQVRNRGTIGGAVAHADPAGDVPCALLALEADAEIVGVGGARRRVPLREFFTGFWSTVLEPGEILCALHIPKRAGEGWSYQKFTTRAQDWATVAVAVQGRRVALASMGERPLRAAATENALIAKASLEDAAAVADEATDPPEDLRGSVAYRRSLARTLTLDALREARTRYVAQ